MDSTELMTNRVTVIVMAACARKVYFQFKFKQFIDSKPYIGAHQDNTIKL